MNKDDGFTLHLTVYTHSPDMCVVLYTTSLTTMILMRQIPNETDLSPNRRQILVYFDKCPFLF